MITNVQRVLAIRLRGQWTASADDGVRSGQGGGYSWEAAVRAALRELDDKHAAEVLAQSTESTR